MAATNEPRVGFIGVGRMGLPVCANLVRAGYEVCAGDQRGELEQAVLAVGARWCARPAALAAGADVLFTMVPGPPEVLDLMLAAGALEALPSGATWIDLSSSSPSVGAEIAELALGRGVHCVDAPVSGGPDDARARTVQLFVGGEPALVQRQRSLLEALTSSDRIYHVGGHGAGYTTKLLVNLLWFGQAVATGEALAVGERAGIDLDVLRGALAASPAASDFIRHDLDALLAGDYLTSFGLDRCCEELGVVSELARSSGVSFALSQRVQEIYEQALSRFGPVDGELLAVALIEEQSGLRLRHGS